MTVSTIAIIGVIIAVVLGLVGGLMLLKGWRMWRQERWAEIPSGTEEEITRPGPRSICHQCGMTLRVGASFCPHCGTARVIGGRYKILTQMGQGGMGVVYLVEDQRLNGKRWAMKEMSDAAITNPLERQEAIESFQSEARILATLDHLNLPKVIDFLDQGHNHYLVMDFIEGKTLEVLLSERTNSFAEDKVLEWAGQLCDVLSYLHNQNPPVIFRDLKPANILLTKTGPLKLIDFGIARLFTPGKASDTRKLGTPGYSPPEQYGQGQTDARSDIYALGVTLHRLLTMHDPTDTPFSLPKVRQLNPNVSVKFEQVIEQATQADSAYRFQTTEAMKQALGIN